MEDPQKGLYDHLRILIAEDNRFDAELLESDLREAGFVFEAKIVATRPDYIKALGRFCPDLILSDYDLPSFTGSEALRIKKEKCPEVPFILITGAVGEERAIEILTGGATDYVLKNNLSRLVPAVRRALHESYEHRKRKEAEAERDSLLKNLENRVRERTEALEREIVERRQVEKKLAEIKDEIDLERKRLHAILEATPFAVASIEARTKVVSYTNRRTRELYGTEFIGRNLDYVRQRVQTLQPDGTPYPDEEKPVNRAFRGEEICNEEVTIELREDGDRLRLTMLLNVVPLHDAEGNVTAAIVVFDDITDRKRREMNAAVLAEIDRVFATTSSADEIMQAVGSKIGSYLEIENCFLAEVDEEKDRVCGLYSWRTAMLPESLRVRRLSAFVNEAFRKAAHAGQTIVVRNARTDSRIDGARYADFNIHAYVTVPFQREGQWRYLFTVIDSAPRDWREDEIDLIREVANRTFPRLEQARAEAVLRESEERYRLIFENSMDGILFTRSDGSILSANPAAREILGRTEEEIMAAEWKEITDDSDPRLAPALDKQARTGKFFGELNFKRKDGTIIPVEVSSVVFRIMTGRAFSSMIFRDIRWRKEAERVLKESEKRFREMADAIPHLVWTATPDGQIDYFNRRGGEFFAATREASGYWNWERLIHPEDLRETVSLWLRCVKTKTEGRIEHRIRDKSGGYRWYLTRYLPLRDDGKVTRWIGTTTDIHDLKEAETNLRNRTRELEKANRELESFSYSVSHDLRAPLRAISGFSGMLLKDEQSLGPESKRKIRVIRENALKMDRLINDLLDLSRSGRTPISSKKIDMDRLVKTLWQEQVAANPDRKMVLQKAELPPAFGDEALIRQVLSNLLANAVKFTRRKQNAVIEVGGEARKGENVYFVKDNGTGFDMKYYGKLFGVFQRLHFENDYEGTGVGLTIAQRIVCRHGGRIWAEGRVGEGATFHFALPAAGE